MIDSTTQPLPCAHSGPVRALARVAFVLTVIFPWAIASAQVTAEVQLSHRTQYVNDPIELRVLVDGTTQASVPDTPEIPGVEVEFVTSAPRSSRTVSFFNGRRVEEVTESVTFVYRLVSREAGSYQVPPIVVNAGGDTLTTRAQSFRIIVPDRPDDFILEAELEKNEAYVGEPVGLTMTWFVGLEVDSASFERNRPPEGVRVLPKQDPSYNANSRSSNMQAFGIFGDVTTAVLGRQERDGRRFTTVTIEATLVPERPGEFTIGPLGVDFNFARPGERRYTRGESVAEALSLRVRPLPEQGRPAGFDGLIGSHDISARLDRTEVSVGDPITLRVDIQSDNPHTLLDDGPSLDDIPEFARNFRADSDGWKRVPGMPSGRRAFTRTVRVNDEGIDALPPIPLWWFDPAEATYHRASSEAIPITVRPTRVVTAADASGTASGTEPRSAMLPESRSVRDLVDTGPGLWGLDRDPLASSRPAGSSFAVLGADSTEGTSWLYVIVIPPALAFAAWVVATGTRRTDGGAQRIARARSRAFRAIASAHRPGDLGDALARFSVAARGRPESAACAADLTELLQESGVPLSPALSDVCEQPERSRFGLDDRAREVGAEERREAARLVRELSRVMLKRLDRAEESRS